MSKAKGHRSVFILVGEASGDLHGGHLAAKLKGSDVAVEGVAGPHMRREGVSGPLAMEDFEVMGFTDVLKALPRLYRQFQLLCNHILKEQPDAVIFIDYPGFNLRLSKALRKKGFKGKLIHYISPSVWAWGKKRTHYMAQYLDLLLTIYPFEAAYFSHTPLPVEYVGNPLCNYIDSYIYDAEWKNELGLKENASIVGIFPGSRAEEIHRNLPMIIQTALQFLVKHPTTVFAISCTTPHAEVKIRKTIQEIAPAEYHDNFVFVPKKWTYELMQSCRCAIAKSGTVTLELALHDIPTAVVYKLTRLNKFIAQYILQLKLPYYCIVNILGDEEIFPELIAKDASVESLNSILENLYSNDIYRKQKIQACHILHKRLSYGNASSQAAEAILRTLL